VTPAAAPGPRRTPARRKARQLAKYLRGERPDYAYLKDVFRHLRDELGVEVTRAPRKLPYVPTEAEIRAFYDAVWKARRAGAAFLFESSWKKPYSDRGVRKILARYTQAAGITASISPHTLRHFLFTWLKTQGIDDALIQPYSGHATRQSLEIYSRLALADAQQRYDDAIGDFPV
jgi:integrase/recombinase XerD